jgi:hypothetical protein
MRKFHWLIIGAMIIVASCKKKSALPEGILPREKMQEIIWDLTTAGEFLNAFVYSKDTSIYKPALNEAWYEKVYSLHQVTRENFLKSYTYYQTHPVLMREVLDTLAKRQIPEPSLLEYGQKIQADSVANKYLMPAQRRADSIRRRLPGMAKRSMDSLRRVRALQRKANPIKPTGKELQ